MAFKKSQSKGQVKPAAPPIGVWGPPVALGWLIPGAGHFLLHRRGRALLLAFSVVAMFVLGILMGGAMFKPQTGDILTILINCGGFAGNLASGSLYLLANLLGYNQADMPGQVHDYGTKFLVTAGLLNILAMVDAYEIAGHRKD